MVLKRLYFRWLDSQKTGKERQTTGVFIFGLRMERWALLDLTKAVN